MPRWKNAEITQIKDLGPTTKSFTLNILEEEVFSFRAGQFITFDLDIAEKRLDRWRSYSIASAPSKDNTIELCIVKLEGGRASTYLFDQIKQGDTLKLKGPGGAFYLPDTITNKLVFICTGTGLAPFRSMLLDLDKKGDLDREVHLIFGTRKEEGILYRKELEALQEKYPKFRYDICLSRSPEWPSYKGYVHQVYEQVYTDNFADTSFLLCGWSHMVDEARKKLEEEMGVPKAQIFYELYG